MNIIHCILYTVYCTLHNVQFTSYTTQCTLYSVQCTHYFINCSLYTAQCTIYNVHIHFTLYTVHWYTVHWYPVFSITFTAHCRLEQLLIFIYIIQYIYSYIINTHGIYNVSFPGTKVFPRHPLSTLIYRITSVYSMSPHTHTVHMPTYRIGVG